MTTGTIPPATTTLYNITKYNLLMVRDNNFAIEQQIRCAADVKDLLRQYFSGLDREHFVVVAMDARNNVTGINTVSVGSLDQTLVHPRETFKFAILSNASSVILAHNHPSGSTEPSHEDIVLTKRLCEAGSILGIEVLDHIIITDNDGLSFKDKNLLPSYDINYK